MNINSISLEASHRHSTIPLSDTSRKNGVNSERKFSGCHPRQRRCARVRLSPTAISLTHLPSVWERIELSGTDVRYLCKACKDGIHRQFKHLTRHTSSAGHIQRTTALKKAEKRARKQQGLPPLPDDSSSSEESDESAAFADNDNMAPTPPAAASSSPVPEDPALIENAALNLLASIAYPEGLDAVPSDLELPAPPAGIPQGWSLWGQDSGNDEIPDPFAVVRARQVSQNMLHHLLKNPMASDSSSGEESDSGPPPDEIVREVEDESSDDETHEAAPQRGIYGSKRQKTTQTSLGDMNWYPWHDQLVSTPSPISSVVQPCITLVSHSRRAPWTFSCTSPAPSSRTGSSTSFYGSFASTASTRCPPSSRCRLSTSLCSSSAASRHTNTRDALGTRSM